MPENELYYTPWKVRDLLSNFATLLDAAPASREDPFWRRIQRNHTGHGWREEAMCKRADIEHALQALPWFTRQIVWHSYVLGDSDRHIATILGCDAGTVRRHKLDGLERMAVGLGYTNVQAWRAATLSRSKRTPAIYRADLARAAR